MIWRVLAPLTLARNRQNRRCVLLLRFFALVLGTLLS